MINRSQVFRLMLGLIFLAIGTDVAFAREIHTKEIHKIEFVPITLHSSINAVAFSPDSNYVLSGGKDNTMRLWDAASGRLVRTFHGHYGSVNSVTFSPDGTTALSGSDDSTIRLWDTSTGQVIRIFHGHKGQVMSLAFSQDGARIVSGSRSSAGDDDTIRLWNVATGEQLRIISSHSGEINSVALSPDGTKMLTGSSGNSRVRDGRAYMQLWDARTGKLLRTFSAYAGAVHSVAFSPSGLLAVSSSSNIIEVRDLVSGRLIHHIEGHKCSMCLRIVKSVAFSPDGTRILSGGSDGTVKLWEVASGRLVHTFEGYYSRRNLTGVAAFSPDGLKVIAASNGVVETLALWDATTDNVRSFGERSAVVRSISTSPDNARLLSGYSTAPIKVWDLTSGQLALEFGWCDDYAYLSIDGSTVIAGNSRLTFYEAASGKKIDAIWILESLKVRLLSSLSAFSQDTTLIAFIDSDTHKVLLWNAEKQRVLRTFNDSLDRLRSIAFSPDASRLATGGADGKTKVWDVATGTLLRTMTSDAAVNAIKFSPDGRRLLTGHEGRMTMWDIDTGVGSTFGDHKGRILSVAFSSDGAHVLSSGEDATIKLWDATGRLIRTFEGHSGPVEQVLFLPNGKRIVSMAQDTTIRIWDVETGEWLVAILTTEANGEWLVLTPEGFFNAAGKGSELLSVVRGLDVYEVGQFFQSLYRPDLVREKLAGDPRGLVREAATRIDLRAVLASGNAPRLKMITSIDTRIVGNQFRPEVEITNQGGGIGRIEWRVNGVVVGVEDRNIPAAQNAATLRIARDLVVEEGPNEIEVVAYNQQNLIASVPVRTKVTAWFRVAQAKARVYVLAIGLNDYAERGLRLAHAVADAQALATAFPDSGRTLYQAVDSVVLRDADVTSAGLDAAFTELAAKIKPQDIFVFFIAGHGKTIDGRYYFIPQNFRLDRTDGVQSVVRQGITQEQWQRWFARIPAKRSLLLFDTCESGSLTGEALETRALERTAAHGRLAESTGRTIITASTDTGPAYEGYQGHGLFAYNLLGALQNADTDNDGIIKVSELAAYTYSQVLELSEQVFNLRQVPQIQITGTDYPIGKPTPVLEAAEPAFKIAMAPTHVVTKGIETQVRPLARGLSVRKLDPNTKVTVVKSEQGWALIAQQGKPLGYVPLASIDPIQDQDKRPNPNRPN